MKESENILLILINASNLNFFSILFSFSLFLSPHLCAKCLLEILKFNKDTLVKRLSKSVFFTEKLSGSSYCHDNGITLSHVMFIHGKQKYRGVVFKRLELNMEMALNISWSLNGWGSYMVAQGLRKVPRGPSGNCKASEELASKDT